ncbi:hypothetical protein FDK21_11965 [Cohaesibacter sp. CAU 1516]|uniref:hypothetical protein n=1 Tax=Cohaesibacter sp. CAU 1516 TaxID=2576038 RepID=UPI0010FD4730|nr:hypothetical protein [Cohaesibacter sp. CAU 1516]TLP45471.1 hypothetical protein FDK21_11965 [Cohaesibacter sp. CAU 1516]
MTALFWQELVLIIFAVVIGMMLGGYFRRYFSPAAADQRKATKEKLAAAAASTAVGSATVSKLTDVKDKVLTKMAEAHLEAEAEALAAKTNKDLEGQTVEVDKAVLRDMTVVAIEEDKEPPVETPDDAHFEQYSDADASFLNDEIAAKTEEAREAVVEAASLGASDAELTQLGTDYAAASEAGDANQAPKAEETVEAPSAAEKAEEAREAVVEAASLGASDAELTQLGTDYAAASEAVSDEAGMAAALAALPADASDEDRANAVGSRPTLLKKPKGGKADDLKKIKGIGKVLEGKLNDLGIHHFEQIANWSQAEVNWVTTFLSFKGRIEREEWIPQAKGLLAAAAPTTKAQTPAKAKAAPKAKAPAKATAAKTAPVKPNETVDLAAEEAEVAAALAALPKDASAEDKANAAGAKPQMLAAPRDNAADDLKRIKGVGKVLEGKLNDLGIYHFDQIANWSRKEINWVTTFLSFKGRIDREEWIEQAKLLAAGEDTAFSKRVDKGEVDSSKA